MSFDIIKTIQIKDLVTSMVDYYCKQITPVPGGMRHSCFIFKEKNNSYFECSF